LNVDAQCDLQCDGSARAHPNISPRNELVKPKDHVALTAGS